jgi:hypothetical protein
MPPKKPQPQAKPKQGKKRPLEEVVLPSQDDIESESDQSEQDNRSETSEEVEDMETVDEKRLRLAKEYLDQMKKKGIIDDDDDHATGDGKLITLP